MIKVALYARYSSDNQSVASIDDQFRICREQAAREKWKIVGTYHDAAISGASVILRPGIQSLLQDAQRGRFEIVLAEALDRVSRDQADVATLFKHLRFAGVQIVTLSEGEISELHVGLKGTMNALFLKDLAAKTHRGIRGRVEKGKSGGGLCYGYDVVRHTDAEGEPIRGERTINETQAEIVRRVFRAFAAGISPRAIARRLNEEGIPGPDGALWTDSTLRGHAARGTGLINNELYIGKLVWNRLRYVKDPATGRRVSRLNPRDKWITTEVPELRIVDDELWQAAKARQGELAVKYANVITAVRAAHANRLNGTHRPRSLLSGLLVCGCCGGPYALRGQDRYACSNHVMNGSCSNSRSITRAALEARMLEGLRARLMAPEIATEAMRAYAEETNRLNRERRAGSEAERRELDKITRSIKEIVTLIEDGSGSRALLARLRELEGREDELTERLSRAPVDIPDIHPNVAGIYRRKVERLAEALQHPQECDEAADAIRALIDHITLTPGPRRGEIAATLHGDLGTILEWTAQKANTPGLRGSGVSVSIIRFCVRAPEGSMPRLTKRVVDRITPCDKETMYWDDELRGFGVRVWPSGRKVYMIMSRVKGRLRRITIGTHGPITAAKARVRAHELLAEAKNGRDPVRELDQSRRAPTMKGLGERFLQEYVALRCKPNTQAEYTRSVNLFINPKLGTRKVTDIERRDISELHHELQHIPYQANRTLGVLSKMFNLAEAWGLRPDGSNPCKHVKKYAEHKRERFLDSTEISGLGRVLHDIEKDGSETNAAINAIRLLMLTGCRLSEIMTLKWEHVDLKTRELRLPDSKTGAKIVPFGRTAAAVLKGIEKVADNPYVITGKNPSSHLSDLQHPWRRIRSKAKLDGVRIHDLRHSYASGALALGEGLP